MKNGTIQNTIHSVGIQFMMAESQSPAVSRGTFFYSGNKKKDIIQNLN